MLPKYYFQDLPAEVMYEIMSEMRTADFEPDWEEIDRWINCNNRPAQVPAWYGRAAEFASSSR